VNNFMDKIRQRKGAVIGGVLGSAVFCIMGAFFIFGLSSKDRGDLQRVQALPQLDAAAFDAAPAGEEVLIGGTLQGNEAVSPQGYVAYVQESWDVTWDTTRDKNEGDWDLIERQIPALTIATTGGTLTTAAVADDVELAGLLEEDLQRGNGSQTAYYGGSQLPEGSVRTRGFLDGSQITVVGVKQADGSLTPDVLYAGDRAMLEGYYHRGAQAGLIIGLVLLACSPLTIALTLLSVFLAKNK
jgi:hypothetical protein